MYSTPMTHHLLTKAGLRAGMLASDAPALPPVMLWGSLPLARARLHEATGPARRVFALHLAAALTGPILWIRPAWLPECLNPNGMQPWIDPTRLIQASPTRPQDLLWCAEESLRSGAAALVVAELPEPPPLTPVRRLHLAAETGGHQGRSPPLGLLLTPGDGGAPGVETRWHMTPEHHADSPETLGHWRLTRSRARTAPMAQWQLSARPGDIQLRPFNVPQISPPEA